MTSGWGPRVVVSCGLALAFAVFWLLVIGGCGAKCNSPGGPANGSTPIGSIAVMSVPAGAAVFLDGVATGAVTDTILAGVVAGSHEVRIGLDGFLADPESILVDVADDDTVTASFTLAAPSAARIVLIEHFSNTSCDPCVEVEENLELLVPSFGFARVVTVGDHLNWPAPDDPFFLANAQQLFQRRGQFGVNVLPEVRINGVKFDDAANYEGFAQAVEKAEEAPPSFAIDVSAAVVGDSFVVTGSVKKIADTAEGDEVLVVAVIETDIHYDAANGVDFFDDISRRFLPGTAGDALALTVGESVSFRYAAKIGVEWNSQHLEAVAFVESAASRKVYQAGSTR